MPDPNDPTYRSNWPNAPGQPSLIGSAENMKLLYDDTMSDLSFNRKSMLRHQDGWETLRLMNAQNAAIASHAINMNVVISAQTGYTDSAAPVTPIKQGAADAQNQQPAGAVYPPIRNADQMGATASGVVETAMAGVATANQSIADAVANLMNALTATITAASGNAASTSGK